jgi:hypothetical protein
MCGFHIADYLRVEVCTQLQVLLEHDIDIDNAPCPKLLPALFNLYPNLPVNHSASI